MKATLDRIPTWVLAVVLVGLMGLLWYGLATRPGAQTASTSPEPSPTSALDAPDTGAAGEADGGRNVGEATEPGEPPADDQAPRGTAPDEGQADDGDGDDADGDDGDTEAAPDGSNSSDAGDRETTSNAGGNVGARAVGADGSVPGDSLVSSGGVTVVPAPAPDDRNDADADAFEADQDEQQDELAIALEEAEPTIEQPGIGELEADARALADDRRDPYFEQQLEELEP